MTHFVILDEDQFLQSTANPPPPVDISDLTETNDYISVALPDYQAAKINQATSFIDLTSNSLATFGGSDTDSIPFSSSSPSLPTVGTADAEFRFPISLLTHIDRSGITGVRFRIDVSTNCTFRCLAIRALSEDWEYAPIDLDTLYGRVQRPPTLNGGVTPTYTFPTTAMGGMPTGWPIVFRADDSPVARDPRPIDSSVALNFVTGGIHADGSSEANKNIIQVYFREVPVDNQINLEMDAYTQAELEVAGHQPDFGTALFTSREQDDIDIQIQSELDAETQFDLERLPDYTTHSWIVVTLKWSSAGTELSIKNADGDGYTFTGITLIANGVADLDLGHYIMIIDVKDNSVRAQIFATDQTGVIDQSAVVFDSGTIVDSEVAPRWKGRFGWWAQFKDGDAYLNDIRGRDFTFAEAITQGFSSNTPVMGAQLFSGATTDLELYEEISAAPWGAGEITVDPAASKTGKAFKVTNAGGVPLQGIQTNEFNLDSIEDLNISFDLRFPTASLQNPGSGLEIFLLGEFGRILSLHHTPINGGKWEKVRVTLPTDAIQTGPYNLVMVQSLPDVETVWWIENISIKVPVVKWSARGERRDAWGMNEDTWLPFKETLNTNNGGVVFKERGKSLQIRAEARRQQAEIHEFKVLPKYAELGRITYPDEVPALGAAPVAHITSSISARTVTLDGSTSTDADNAIIAYHWSFGDGTYAIGPKLAHTYVLAGTYKVVLTVTDTLDNQATSSANITVA